MAPDLPETLPGAGGDGSTGRRRGTDSHDEEDLERFVRFELGGHRLAVPVAAVRTVTDEPSALTRVPRSPPAIEGLTDLRGEITVVIDPRVHFPSAEASTGNERLLVFDRPNDEQSAAIRIDAVLGVDAVPADQVYEDEDLEGEKISGDALEHPLVVALVEQERDEAGDGTVASSASTGDGIEPGTALNIGGRTDAGGASPIRERERTGGDAGETFEFEHVEDGTDDGRREIVVEVSAVVDVERLLLASGHGRGTGR